MNKVQHFVGSNFTSNMDVTSRKAQLVCDRKKFEESLPKVIDQVIGPHCEQTKDAIEHYREVCITILLPLSVSVLLNRLVFSLWKDFVDGNVEFHTFLTPNQIFFASLYKHLLRKSRYSKSCVCIIDCFETQVLVYETSFKLS
jgi:hypothetical protein